MSTATSNPTSIPSSISSFSPSKLPSAHPFRKQWTFTDVWEALKHPNPDYVNLGHITLDLISDNSVSLISKVFRLLAVFLIILLGSSAICFILPIVFDNNKFMRAIFTFIGLWILYCIFYFFFKASFTFPGSPSDFVHPEIGTMDDPNGNEKNWCRKCSFYKPERARHCKTCGCCIMRMDHHCPWLGNCVGLKNYRYFYFFLFWTCFGTFVLSAICGKYIYNSSENFLPTDAQLSRTFIDLKIQAKEFFRSQELSEEEKKSIIKQTLYKQKNKDKIRLERGRKVRESFEKFRERLNKKQEDYDRENLDEEQNEQEVNRFRLLTNTNSIDYIEDKISYRVTEDNLKVRNLESSQDPNQESIFSTEKNEVDDEELKQFEEISQYEVGTEYLYFFLVFSLASAICLAVGILFSFHTYLISKGETTLEFFNRRAIEPSLLARGRKYQNPYDYGVLRNFKRVFGSFNFFIASLPLETGPIQVDEIPVTYCMPSSV